MILSKLAAPFSLADREIIRKYLLNNMATAKQGLTKTVANFSLKALPGAIIAAPALPSPSFSQDYFFYWVRDGAIAMTEIIRFYRNETDPDEKNELKQRIFDYIDFVKKVQQQPALNGINILGEPKFNIDGSLWTGQWSRPQQDGAAYQAIALVNIADILLQEGQEDFVIQNIYNPNSMTSILKANLEYTAVNWLVSGVGPWEELSGCHFAVEAVQRRALIAGSYIASRLNDRGAAAYYSQQAAAITQFMQKHWDDNLGYYFDLFSSQDVRGGGINASVIIGLVYGQIEHAQDPFVLTSERSLSTAFYVRNAFDRLYLVNAHHPQAPLIGRYQADIYDGNHNEYGNPWFLCSNLLAAFYYKLVKGFFSGEKVMISFLVKQFFKQVAPQFDLTVGQIFEAGLPHFQDILNTLFMQADAILAAVKSHCATYADGSTLHMSEQINRASGEAVSAPDLSWSYASLLTAMHAREDAVNAEVPVS